MACNLTPARHFNLQFDTWGRVSYTFALSAILSKSWGQGRTVSGQHLQHRSGRTTAFIYLLIGLVMLLYVFWQSYQMLTHPVPGLVLPHAASTGAVTPSVDFGRMGAAVVSFLLNLLVLLVMTIVGSLIAARGVHLYHVASAPTDALATPAATSPSSPPIAGSSADDAPSSPP